MHIPDARGNMNLAYPAVYAICISRYDWFGDACEAGKDHVFGEETLVDLFTHKVCGGVRRPRALVAPMLYRR